MVTFRNNNNTNRRNNYRRNDRTFKSSNDRQKYNSTFANSDSFKRKSPGRNNHNAAKLIEKYNDLAREASSNGDKILSENYLQHADHFTRVLNEKENFKREKINESKIESRNISSNASQEVANENPENDVLENTDQSGSNNKEKPQVEAS